MSRPESVMHRRRFLGHVGAGAATIAGVPALAAAVPPSPAAPGWDLSWVDRIESSHRMVFDTPDVAHGMAVSQVANWLYGYKEAYGLEDKDVNPVLVLRHMAVVMALSDEMWARLDIGERLAIKDRATGLPARRNPFLAKSSAAISAAAAKPAATGDGHHHKPEGVDSLMARGTIVLACGLALSGQAHQLQEREKLSPEVAQREIRAHLLPGAYVMPSGVFAVGRAQEAGCHYVRAT